MSLYKYNLKYSLRRYYVDTFFEAQMQSIAKQSRIIEVGGDKINKRGKFDISVTHQNVTYINLIADKLPDLIADAKALPISDNTFDVAICGEILEHVPDPRSVLQEIFRVLVPNGKLIITVPFMYHIHAHPYDYGRYTDTFWRENLEAMGYSDIEIAKQGLYFSVMVDNWRQGLLAYNDRSWAMRIFRQVSRWVMPQMVKFAVNRDQQQQTQQHPIYSSYTTGFGISCVKQNVDKSKLSHYVKSTFNW